MQKAFIEYAGYKVHYVIIGKGSRYLFAFHGYGLTGEQYQAFETALGGKYTIISLDLFHHGQSHYPDNIGKDTALEPALFKAMIEKIATGMGIDRFGLMGYSMGGRICLYLLPQFGNRITELYLFAPDGIKRSYGYMLGTYTFIGKALFRLMLKQGWLMKGLLNIGWRIGVVNPKAHKFFLSQIETQAKREKLYYSWQSYRLFRTDLDAVVKCIKENNMALHLFTGKYDRVLPPATVNRLLKKLGPGYVNIRLDSGHDLISTKTAHYLETY